MRQIIVNEDDGLILQVAAIHSIQSHMMPTTNRSIENTLLIHLQETNSGIHFLRNRSINIGQMLILLSRNGQQIVGLVILREMDSNTKRHLHNVRRQVNGLDYI